MGRLRLLVRLLVVVAVLGVSLAAAGVVASPGAGAQTSSGVEQITSYRADLTIEEQGSLLVRETIVYDFGVVPHHGIYRDIPDRFNADAVKQGYDRVTPIDVVAVEGSPGTPVQYSTAEEGTNFRIKIGDPDTTITGEHTYEITYRVRGVYNAFPDHDELVWNVVGTEWPVAMTDVGAVVHAPADIERVLCTFGPYGATTPCPVATTRGTSAEFGVPALDPYESMTVTLALPKGAVADTAPILEERFDLGAAFRVTPATGGIALAMLVLLLGIVVFLVWRFGRDRRYAGSAVDAAFGPNAGAAAEVAAPRREAATPVEFEPPEHLRPGQLGVLIDFKANALDVTATIVDLAVRGYLRIEEVEPSGAFFRKHDWRLVKLTPPDAGGRKHPPLLPYEVTLYDALFAAGDTVLLSALHNTFASHMQAVEKCLMDDAMARGWFRRRPGMTKGLWFALGALVTAFGIALTIGLATATHAALVGLPVIVGGILLMIAARWMPARTAAGYAVLRHTLGFKRFIDESEQRRAEFAERANIFSEYLPYAVVFGATGKWAEAFGGLDDPPPDTSSWYVARLPLDYLMFSAAINGFAVTSVGTLTSTPASSGSSGFSGGGFSGGGFGGGGGGSW